MSAKHAWAIERCAGDADSYRCLHDDQGRYVADIHGLVTETTEHLDDRARRVVASLNACAGIPTEDLEKLSLLGDYLRLIKLSHLADRQAAPLEASHPDHEYVSAGGTA